jgi:multisubunit Na+/H+ antiporter MnhB subunit
MLLAPALLAALSLFLGLAPDPEPLARFFADAAGQAYGGPVKVSLALWTGLTVPLALSFVAVSLGGVIFLLRVPVRAWQARVDRGGGVDRFFEGTLRAIDRAAYLATRVQSGPLRRYLAAMLVGLGILILFWGRLPMPAGWPSFDLGDPLAILRLFVLILAVAATALSIFLRQDFMAILALGASGLSIAVMMVLEPAPDVALVQVVVDILAVVVLTLALANIPREQRARSFEFTFRQSRPGLIRDALLAAGAGLVMAALCYTALASRPRESVVTPYYEANAKLLTGAADIVGAVVVDFRGFDTLIEIVVFGMAGLGVYTLLRYAARQESGAPPPAERTPAASQEHRITGIYGARTSPMIHALAYVLLPVTLVLAATQIMYGHDQAGDGFTAGVMVSLAIAFWYVVFGYHATRRQLPWLRPPLLVGCGLALILADASLTALLGGSFFAHLDYGEMLGLSLPAGFGLTSSFFFEVAICLTVLGGASATLGALGHPKDDPVE